MADHPLPEPTADEATEARGALLRRVQALYRDPELHLEYPYPARPTDYRVWRVVSGGSGVVGTGPTAVEALLSAIEARVRQNATKAARKWVAMRVLELVGAHEEAERMASAPTPPETALRSSP